MATEIEKGPTGRIKGLRGLLSGLTREDVLGVLAHFKLEAAAPYRFMDSTDYDLVHEGKHFPPKAILGLAAERTVGRALTSDEFAGGDASTCFAILGSLGFAIRKKEVDSEDLSDLLASLRPNSGAMVMELVRDAGIDISPWATKKDGTPVVKPQANPAYCYEWCFGGGDEPTALCVWHGDVTIADSRICYEDNLRDFAYELDKVAISPGSPEDVVSRARSQAKRARKFDGAIQRAVFKKQPVRIIILIGDDMGTDKIGWDTSKVQYRSLDDEPWSIEQYNMDSGQFRLVRGNHATATVAQAIPVEPAPSFVDQFSIPVPVERVAVQTAVLPRSAEVRRKVLDRANGLCECCGEAGFKMANGAIYLETHHVIPLGEGGPDIEWNVVAICPNDHRRAHYAVERDELQERLIGTLTENHPQARDPLLSLRVECVKRDTRSRNA